VSRDFSRDETEYGCFGDSWGATIAPRVTAGVTVAVPAAVRPPAVKASVAALPATVQTSLSSLTRRAALPASALTAAVTSGTLKTPAVVSKPLSSTAAKAVASVLSPASKPVAPVTSSGQVDPRTLDFMTGQTNLAPTTVKPAALPLPVLSSADQLAINANRVRADAAKTSAINANYRADRAAADQDTLRFNDAISRADWNIHSGADWGLIPLGLKVLATGAAVIATAGTAAVAVAGAGVSAASIGSLVTADGIIAAASKVGGKDAQAALNVIDSTSALASGGNVDAQKGLAVLAAVAADRVQKGVPAGVTQTPSALAPLASNPILAAATAAGRLGFQGDFSPDVLAAAKPKQAIVSTKKPVDLRLAADTVMPSDAALAAAADARLRWSVLDSGKIYRGPAPSGAGGSWRVYDSGRIDRTVA
jgi:hypothetical protein